MISSGYARAAIWSYTDAVTLKKVSEDVNRLLDRDEDLEEEENQELKKRLDRFMEEKYEKLNL